MGRVMNIAADDLVRVTFHDETGEGRDGDFRPEDPDDVLLLRFDVDQKVDGEWQEVRDGSYCTALPASIGVEKMEEYARELLELVADHVRAGVSIKRVCEEASWWGA